jgi:MoaA/NifB/PqqE/SkfB family radical SAM enzyme
VQKFSKRDLLGKGYRFLLKRPDPSEILWLNIAVTYWCNARCMNCRIWEKYRTDPAPAREELSVNEIRRLIESPFMSHLQGVSLTGGEPTLRDDLPEIASVVVDHAPETILATSTNGLNPSRIEGIVGKILNYEPRRFSISVSLDGTRKTHDRLRGTVGAYDSVLDTVKRLQEFDIRIGLHFTISRENWADLPEIHRLSLQLGIGFLANFAHESPFFYSNTPVSGIPTEDLDEIQRLVEKTVQDRQAGETLAVRLLDPYPFFLASMTRHQRQQSRLLPCYSGTHSLFLDPHGSVYPCPILDRPMGNIRQEDFSSLWMSIPATETRRFIAAERCHCWVACDAVPSLLRGIRPFAWNISQLFRGGDH